MCPGNRESAGKYRSGRTGHGSKWLRIALVEAGQADGRSKDTYLSASSSDQPRPDYNPADRGSTPGGGCHPRTPRASRRPQRDF